MLKRNFNKFSTYESSFISDCESTELGRGKRIKRPVKRYRDEDYSEIMREGYELDLSDIYECQLCNDVFPDYSDAIRCVLCKEYFHKDCVVKQYAGTFHSDYTWECDNYPNCLPDSTLHDIEQKYGGINDVAKNDESGMIELPGGILFGLSLDEDEDEESDGEEECNDGELDVGTDSNLGAKLDNGDINQDDGDGDQDNSDSDQDDDNGDQDDGKEEKCIPLNTSIDSENVSSQILDNYKTTSKNVEAIIEHKIDIETKLVQEITSLIQNTDIEVQPKQTSKAKSSKPNKPTLLCNSYIEEELKIEEQELLSWNYQDPSLYPRIGWKLLPYIVRDDVLDENGFGKPVLAVVKDKVKDSENWIVHNNELSDWEMTTDDILTYRYLS